MRRRLAYVCADAGIPVFGSKGASVHVQEVVRALRSAGVDVEIFAVRCEAASAHLLPDVPCHPLPAPEGSDAAERERQALALYDVVPHLLDRAGPFDMIYERYSLWSTAAMRYARRHAIPGLLEVNAPLIEEQAAHRVLIDRAAAERCAADVFETADAVLAVSRPVAEYVASVAPLATVHVVPNGVDPDRCAPHVVPARPAGAGVRTLGFVGSMKPWHGIDLLLDAFDRVQLRMPASRLLIVGDGPERARVAARASQSDSVVLTGPVPAGGIPSLLTSMDVAVAPYPDRSDFYFSPLKIFEYMSAGLPIVASRIGQIDEILEHDRTAVLVRPGDAAAIADAVIALFEDPARRCRLGGAARARARERHTWSAVAGRILDIASAARATARTAAVQA
jgi:glycosyltransferase involved in cell wall biosynthesis